MTLKIKAREGCLWRRIDLSSWFIMIKFDTKNDIVVHKSLPYGFYSHELRITTSIFNGQHEDEYEVIYPCKLMKLVYGIE